MGVGKCAYLRTTVPFVPCIVYYSVRRVWLFWRLFCVLILQFILISCILCTRKSVSLYIYSCIFTKCYFAHKSYKNSSVKITQSILYSMCVSIKHFCVLDFSLLFLFPGFSVTGPLYQLHTLSGWPCPCLQLSSLSPHSFVLCILSPALCTSCLACHLTWLPTYCSKFCHHQCWRHYCCHHHHYHFH